MIEPYGAWVGDEEQINFVVSSIKSEKKTKPRPRGPYEPEEFAFDQSTEQTDWADREIRTQIGDTISTMEQKILRSGDEIFFVLDLKYDPSYHEVRHILNRLDATILAYLNDTHNKILVAAPKTNLAKIHAGKKIPKYFGESLHMLRPRLVYEQLSKELKAASPEERKLLLFKIMPNVSEQKNDTYIHKLEEYLRSQGCQVYDTDLRELGFVAAEATPAIAQSVAEKSTFVYDINAAPAALVETVKQPSIRSSKKSKPVIVATALSVDDTIAQQNTNPPRVVVMDSGAEDIAPLNGVVTRDGHPEFAPPFDDGVKNDDGHGTPICYLIAYGENAQKLPIKIISYKIFSSDKNKVAHEGIVKAIEKYKKQSRLFVSSIGFEQIPLSYVAELDMRVQEENMILVCAAGNIFPREILSHITNNKPYPLYLEDYNIYHPSTGVNIVSVGAIAKRQIERSASSYSIAPAPALSPHSRCGNGNPMLYRCRKPEVVDHGGNLNFINGTLSREGVGVTAVNSKGVLTESLAGTSFAAPLFMRKLAKIEARWGDKIKNAETLKAIAYISCMPIGGFNGYGEASFVTGTSRNHALYVTESEIPLEDRTDKHFKTVSRGQSQKMKIPQGIGRIDVCVVHSDNIEKSVEPTLSSYLDVEMRKTGSNSKVLVNAGDPREKTNVKFLTYMFDSHSMEAQWWLNVAALPTAPILPEEMKNAKVRYGCAVLLSRRDDYSNLLSVNQQISAD